MERVDECGAVFHKKKKEQDLVIHLISPKVDKRPHVISVKILKKRIDVGRKVGHIALKKFLIFPVEIYATLELAFLCHLERIYII